jgi:hypothetical protein
MPIYLVLMHSNVPTGAAPSNAEQWESYITALADAGHLRGGSSLGPGKSICLGQTDTTSTAFSGYLKVEAASPEEVQHLSATNPDFLAGAKLVIFPLVEDD